jgi:hypothetical protein
MESTKHFQKGWYNGQCLCREGPSNSNLGQHTVAVFRFPGIDTIHHLGLTEFLQPWHTSMFQLLEESKILSLFRAGDKTKILTLIFSACLSPGVPVKSSK